MKAVAPKVRVRLVDGFDCTVDTRQIELTQGARRLIALLALSSSPVHRAVAAGRLWPDSKASRAAANLRSALWGGKRADGATIILAYGSRLALAPEVSVDLRELQDELEPGSQIQLRDQPAAIVARLTGNLLPGWSEDWLEYERMRWDQMRVHALERMATELLQAHRFVEALHAALGSLSVDPIRESAHRIVIEIHLAEGNAASALKHHQQYRRMLQRELGTAPSSQMDQLLRRMTSP